MSLLKVNKGVFSYPSGEKVLDEVCYEVGKGELISILGPNGAGKTTLLKCTMGLLGWKEGNSTINGIDIRKLSPRELFSIVAYVPQAKADTPNYYTEEMVLLGRGSRIGFFSQPTEKDREVVLLCMEKLGISHLIGKRCSEISGGELQMVLIARALASEPEIIVLDEPESNLDFKNQLMVMETLSNLTHENVAVLFNTHFPAHALQYSTKALMLAKNGKAIFGNVDEVITEENIKKVFGVNVALSEINTINGTVRTVVPVSLLKGKI
ncbi:MAG: ABC transporter ATP-binding protein [Sphaerochaetaceae bacterium]|nr:ABC transporter ATP-binding protein [Sphaerochaetaceae bacterium]